MEVQSEYGKRLVDAREKLGITLEEVSYELKINLTTLKKLEASDSENLPKPGFTKGFIKAYCKFLNISPVLIVSEYEQSLGVKKLDSHTSVLVESSENKGLFVFDFLKDQVFPLVLFLVVGLAAFALYTFLGGYEGASLENFANKKIEAPVVDVTPVVEKAFDESVSIAIDKKTEEIIKKEEEVEETVADAEVKFKPQAEKVVKSKTDFVSEDIVPATTKTKYTPPKGRHKLRVEPLAKTYLYIKTSTDSRPVRAKLIPEKMRTFVFDQAEIRFLDVGSVNLTLDGQELDALGVFGEEKKIDFPSLKEL